MNNPPGCARSTRNYNFYLIPLMPPRLGEPVSGKDPIHQQLGAGGQQQPRYHPGVVGGVGPTPTSASSRGTVPTGCSGRRRGQGRAFASLEGLRTRVGDIPKDATVRTGSGGCALLFHVRLLEPRSGTLRGGWDEASMSAAEGGYVVAPPSLHVCTGARARLALAFETVYGTAPVSGYTRVAFADTRRCTVGTRSGWGLERTQVAEAARGAAGHSPKALPPGRGCSRPRISRQLVEPRRRTIRGNLAILSTVGNPNVLCQKLTGEMHDRRVDVRMQHAIDDRPDRPGKDPKPGKRPHLRRHPSERDRGAERERLRQRAGRRQPRHAFGAPRQSRCGAPG